MNELFLIAHVIDIFNSTSYYSNCNYIHLLLAHIQNLEDATRLAQMRAIMNKLVNGFTYLLVYGVKLYYLHMRFGRKYFGEWNESVIFLMNEWLVGILHFYDIKYQQNSACLNHFINYLRI
uniref:Uncharacterized protein n=1 Tax=Heterorhabditis bacteriophora TaxID=37862 RepID=A0A1I7WE96_HETBA